MLEKVSRIRTDCAVDLGGNVIPDTDLERSPMSLVHEEAAGEELRAEGDHRHGIIVVRHTDSSAISPSLLRCFCSHAGSACRSPQVGPTFGSTRFSTGASGNTSRKAAIISCWAMVPMRSTDFSIVRHQHYGFVDLIDHVHRGLGRYRSDDVRQGWISGLDEQAGHHHPTKGGLRIGKPLKERQLGEPINERLEWDRDGQ